jgi:fucose 4-O-acetylase-like acetyltransferase
LGGFYWTEMQVRFAEVRPVARRRLKVSLAWFSGITFAYSYASVFLLSKLNQWLLGNPAAMPDWIKSFTLNWNAFNWHIWLFAQKWTVGPLRIVLFVAWFLTLYFLIRRYENRINRASHGLIELLGRNSLFVYITHAFIVFIFKLFIPPITNIYQNFIITAASLILLIGATLYYQQWRDNKARLAKDPSLKNSAAPATATK